MSWLFSQALVEEYSEATSSDGAPSAQSSGQPTPQAYCSPDRMTEFSRLSRFGMTFEPSTADRGEALLTWFLADFRARTSAPPVPAMASTANAPASGVKWRELSVKYCHALSSWRTHRCLWDEALPWSSVTLPRWGMTANGVVFQHPTLERPINATASGLWQTPVADDAIERKAGKWNSRGEPKLSAEVKLWPTPKANDAEKRGNFDTTNPRNGLPAAVKAWPTPTASASKGSSPAALTRKDGQDRSNERLDHAVMASEGGQLNPTWVEWLMGWPLGWTDLKPLAMDKFRAWQQQHSDCSVSQQEATEAAA